MCMKTIICEVTKMNRYNISNWMSWFKMFIELLALSLLYLASLVKLVKSHLEMSITITFASKNFSYQWADHDGTSILNKMLAVSERNATSCYKLWKFFYLALCNSLFYPFSFWL